MQQHPGRVGPLTGDGRKQKSIRGRIALSDVDHVAQPGIRPLRVAARLLRPEFGGTIPDRGLAVNQAVGPDLFRDPKGLRWLECMDASDCRGMVAQQ